MRYYNDNVTSSTRRLLTCFLVFFTTLVAPTFASAEGDAGSQMEAPWRNAQDELQQGNLRQAERWFEVTATDFTSAPLGQSALCMQVLLSTALELSHVKVAHYLNEGAELKLRDKARWQELINTFEENGVKAGEHLLKVAERFRSNDLGKPVEFAIKLSLDAFSDKKFQDRLLKGELIDKSELRELQRKEWLRHVIGLMGETMNVPENQLMAGEYLLRLDRPALYRAIGVRLFFIARQTKKTEFGEESKAFFNHVLTLTQQDPYNKNRQQAQEFIAELDTRSLVPKEKPEAEKK